MEEGGKVKVKTGTGDFAGMEGVITSIYTPRQPGRTKIWVNFPGHPWEKYGPFAFYQQELDLIDTPPVS